MNMRGITILLIFAALMAFPTLGSADDGLFPSLSGWSITPGEKVYVPANLWDLIDGAAELFLSYGFVDLNLAEYRNAAGTDVRVELYRHSSKSNAFGIYSAERNPDYTFLDVGTQGYIEDEVLNFLCGPYYVKITSHRPGQEGRDAMTLIARKIEEHLGEPRAWPAPLALFPDEGRQVNTEGYIAENFLGYRCLHSAYVCQFEAEGTFQMFIVQLETGEQAREMMDAYLKAVHQEPPSNADGPCIVTDPHNGIVRLLLHGKYLCGVLNCRDQKTAKRYLTEVQSRITKADR
jgi:hypothetical protein